MSGDPGDVVVHRVFDGHDVHLPRLELVEGGVQRRRLAAAGRTGDQHDAFAEAQQALQELLLVIGHADVGHAAPDHHAVEDTDDDLFAPPGNGDR
jgi:hypothetical protein